MSWRLLSSSQGNVAHEIQSTTNSHTSNLKLYYFLLGPTPWVHGTYDGLGGAKTLKADTK